MTDDRLAAYLAQALREWEVFGEASAFPRLAAALTRVLARHKPGDGTAEIHTLEKGWHGVTACAACGEPWPCEDYRDISAALLGEEVPGA